MNTSFKKCKTSALFLSIAAIALLSSCTEEEDRYTDVKGDPVTEVVTELDARRIISFSVTNPGEAQAIHSAVNNLDKTITVYLPAYYEYQYLEVAITLPENTTVLPAATELLPVFSTTPPTYTTTAADGTTATYTVQIEIQQPELIVNEISDGTPNFTIQTGSPVNLTGENFLASYEVTKLFVVDAQGNKLWQMKQYNEGLNIGSFYAMYVFGGTAEIPLTLVPDTDYWFRVESYDLAKTMELPFRITN